MSEPRTGNLGGRRLLVIEDEYLVAADLAAALAGEGIEVVGPVATVDDALGLVASEERIDGAVLDINLRGRPVYPVADALRARGIPFLFATGYDAWFIPPAYAGVPHLEKPLDMSALARVLALNL